MVKRYKIGIIKGDGIGPEIIDEAIKGFRCSIWYLWDYIWRYRWRMVTWGG